MSDILARLKALGVTKGMPDKPAAPERKAGDNMTALEKTFPSGFVAENDHGYCFINRLKQPLTQPHGKAAMDAALQPSDLFDSMIGYHIRRKEDTLAFDTETSGLSNGSAGFIFMLGLGYFEGDSYIVDQLILPDLGDEPAFLRQTELIFSRFPILVSYNGKSFDVPMLQSRLNFHLFPDFTKQIAHIDLLTLTRRYWKQTLGSVRLANIEQYLLELERGDEEVPGYMAPELYREFLRDGDAEHISGVAYHNQIDVVSLSAFLLWLNDTAVRGAEDPSVWESVKVPETVLIRHNLPIFSGKAIASLESFSSREKRNIAGKFMRAGETERGLSIYEGLAAEGDLYCAEKLTKFYRKARDEGKFEASRERLLRMIEGDATIGKWTKEDKIRSVKALKLSRNKKKQNE